MKNDEWKMFYIHYRALYPDPLPVGEANQHRLKETLNKYPEVSQ
jgi:hypothetical protein